MTHNAYAVLIHRQYKHISFDTKVLDRARIYDEKRHFEEFMDDREIVCATKLFIVNFIEVLTDCNSSVYLSIFGWIYRITYMLNICSNNLNFARNIQFIERDPHNNFN